MLGALLGMANVTVIAAVIAADLGSAHRAEAFFTLAFLGSIPAVIVGLVLGSVAERTRSWSIGARYALLGIPAAAAVVLFGSMLLPLAGYIVFGWFTTAIAVRILERRTRATQPLPPVVWRDAKLTPSPDGIALGMVLAIANLLVVGTGIQAMERPTRHMVAADVFVLGLIPAVFTGALLGYMANRCRDWPLWARRLVLTLPAFVVVAGLGGAFGLPHYIVPACVPTLAAALTLERITRESMLPTARALIQL